MFLLLFCAYFDFHIILFRFILSYRHVSIYWIVLTSCFYLLDLTDMSLFTVLSPVFCWFVFTCVFVSVFLLFLVLYSLSCHQFFAGLFSRVCLLPVCCCFSFSIHCLVTCFFAGLFSYACLLLFLVLYSLSCHLFFAGLFSRVCLLPVCCCFPLSIHCLVTRFSLVCFHMHVCYRFVTVSCSLFTVLSPVFYWFVFMCIFVIVARSLFTVLSPVFLLFYYDFIQPSLQLRKLVEFPLCWLILCVILSAVCSQWVGEYDGMLSFPGQDCVHLAYVGHCVGFASTSV